MFDKIKYLMDSNKNIIVSFFACIIMVSVLLIMNLSLSLKPSNDIYNEIVTKLNEANDNLTEAINKLTIDSNLACVKLDESSKIINEISTTLLTLDSTYSDDEAYVCISDLVEKTSDLYDLSFQLISNPNDLNDSEKIKHVSLCLNECKDLYDKLNNLGMDIEFTTDTETFFQNTINYANTIITLNRDSDIKAAANKDFMIKLDGFSKPLKSISQDLMPAINKIREDNRSLDPILEDIIEKKDSLEEIKNKLNLLSIPEDCVHFYNSLNNTLVLYDKYINAFENAVLFEKSCGDYSKNKNDIDKKYNNAISKYNDMMNSYNSYKKLLE